MDADVSVCVTDLKSVRFAARAPVLESHTLNYEALIASAQCSEHLTVQVGGVRKVADTRVSRKGGWQMQECKDPSPGRKEGKECAVHAATITGVLFSATFSFSYGFI